MFNLLNEITGGTKTSYDSFRNNSSTLPLCSPPPDIAFANKFFCFTGKFLYGTRNRCEKEIEQRGGLAQRQPAQNTNYLVIGHLGSTDWMHTAFGRKIEDAVELRGKGFPVSIVSEEHWVRYL